MSEWSYGVKNKEDDLLIWIPEAMGFGCQGYYLQIIERIYFNYWVIQHAY